MFVIIPFGSDIQSSGNKSREAFAFPGKLAADRYFLDKVVQRFTRLAKLVWRIQKLYAEWEDPG